MGHTHHMLPGVVWLVASWWVVRWLASAGAVAAVHAWRWFAVLLSLAGCAVGCAMCPLMLVRQQQEVWMDQQRDCVYVSWPASLGW